MNHVFNERTKLLATALNTAAISCFTVGIATPLAGYVYNFGNVQSLLRPAVLLFGLIGWFGAGVGLHMATRRVIGRLVP